jgi:hypothetical protein
VQLGTAQKEKVLESCQASLNHAIETFPGASPAAGLVFSCAGRKMIMGTRVSEEVKEIQAKLPLTPFLGFYCYGEFAPMRKGEPYLFHGATFVTLLIDELSER